MKSHHVNRLTRRERGGCQKKRRERLIFSHRSRERRTRIRGAAPSGLRRGRALRQHGPRRALREAVPAGSPQPAARRPQRSRRAPAAAASAARASGAAPPPPRPLRTARRAPAPRTGHLSGPPSARSHPAAQPPARGQRAGRAAAPALCQQAELQGVGPRRSGWRGRGRKRKEPPPPS